MSFNVPIKVDAGDAPQKIKGVGDALAETERKSDALSQACKRLSQSFGDIGQAIAEKMNRTISQAVRGFGSMNEALQREDAWLTKLRGNTRGFAADMQTLDSMLKRNVITLREHQAAAAQARLSAGIALPTAQPGLGATAGNALLGQVAGIAGPAAIAGASLNAIKNGFDEVEKKAQDMREATASMLRFKDSIEGARESAERMKSMSNLLGTDLKTTTAAFLDVADAASELGLSERKIEDITRSLGMIMKIEGKSIGDVGTVMQQLEFAISKGTISSGELARMMKQFPPLAAIWREEFGGTTKQLLEAADSGQLAKLGLDRLLTSIRTTPEVVDKMTKSSMVTLDAWSAVNGELFKVHNELEKLKGQVHEQPDANRQLIDSWGDVERSGNILARGVEFLTEKVKQLRKALEDPWGNAANNFSTTGTLISEAMGKVNLVFDAGEKIVKKYKDGLRDAAAEQKRWAEEIKKIHELDKKTRLRNVGNSALDWSRVGATVDAIEIAPQPDPTARFNALGGVESSGFFNNASEAEKMLAIANGIADAAARGTDKVSAFDKAWGELSSNMEQGVLQQVTRIGDELANAFMTGEFSARKMVDSIIKDMTRLAIQQAVLFGFKSAFPSLSGSAGLNVVPRFAAGGAGRVDTDSMFVGLRMTPNERLIVQTPGQQMRDRESSAPAAPPQAPVVVNQYDPRALLQVLGTREGATVIHNILREYPGLRR